jgi:putative aldouronate transport system permease protein
MKKDGKAKKKRWTMDDTELSLLALPAVVWYVLFAFLPMFGVVIAFKDFKISGGFLSSLFKSPWAGANGLKNFASLFAFQDIGIIIRSDLGPKPYRRKNKRPCQESGIGAGTAGRYGHPKIAPHLV